MSFSNAFISNLTKKSVFLDYSILKNLKLTLKEFTLLEQLAYNTNKTEFFSFPKTVISRLCDMSRAHLYRCLKSLKDKGLISECENGIKVLETYKKSKTKAFKNSHNIADFNSVVSKNQAIFFMPDVSQNETDVSQNEAPYNYMYKNTKILSERVNKTLSEKIYSLHSQILKKSERESLSHFLSAFFRSSEDSISFYTINDIKLLQNTLTLLKEYISEAKDCIDPYEYQNLRSAIGDNLGSETLEKLDNYKNSLSQTGFFCLKENKIAFISQIKRLYDAGNLKVALDKNNSKVWLETALNNKNKDTKNEGLICLQRLWQVLLHEIKMHDLKENNPEGFKQHALMSFINATYHKYKDKIQEFIAFRKAKKRFFNEASLQALYTQIAQFEAKGSDVMAILNQSIERDYNWIFPITHKKRFFKKKAIEKLQATA